MRSSDANPLRRSHEAKTQNLERLARPSVEIHKRNRLKRRSYHRTVRLRILSNTRMPNQWIGAVQAEIGSNAPHEDSVQTTREWIAVVRSLWVRSALAGYSI